MYLKERLNGGESEGEGISSYWMTLRKKKIMESDRGIVRLPYVEKLLCKRLRTSRKTDACYVIRMSVFIIA